MFKRQYWYSIDHFLCSPFDIFYKWIVGIEPTSSVWKTDIIAVILYPHASERSACFLPLYIIIKKTVCILSRYRRFKKLIRAKSAYFCLYLFLYLLFLISWSCASKPIFAMAFWAFCDWLKHGKSNPLIVGRIMTFILFIITELLICFLYLIN